MLGNYNNTILYLFSSELPWNILLLILGFFILITGLLVITTKSPVHSILLLMLLFLNVTELTIVLGMEFLALILVIVYIGAVCILMLFHIKLIKTFLPSNEQTAPKSKELFFPFIVITIVIPFVQICTLIFEVPTNSLSRDILLSEILWIPGQQGSTHTSSFNYTNWIDLYDTFNSTQIIGFCIYNVYFIYLLLGSFVLLIAMIGSIFLTMLANNKKYKQELDKQIFVDIYGSFLKETSNEKKISNTIANKSNLRKLLIGLVVLLVFIILCLNFDFLCVTIGEIVDAPENVRTLDRYEDIIMKNDNLRGLYSGIRFELSRSILHMLLHDYGYNMALPVQRNALAVAARTFNSAASDTVTEYVVNNSGLLLNRYNGSGHNEEVSEVYRTARERQPTYPSGIRREQCLDGELFVNAAERVLKFDQDTAVSKHLRVPGKPMFANVNIKKKIGEVQGSLEVIKDNINNMSANLQDARGGRLPLVVVDEVQNVGNNAVGNAVGNEQDDEDKEEEDEITSLVKSVQTLQARVLELHKNIDLLRVREDVPEENIPEENKPEEDKPEENILEENKIKNIFGNLRRVVSALFRWIW